MSWHRAAEAVVFDVRTVRETNSRHRLKDGTKTSQKWWSKLDWSSFLFPRGDAPLSPGGLGVGWHPDERRVSNRREGCDTKWIPFSSSNQPVHRAIRPNPRSCPFILPPSLPPWLPLTPPPPFIPLFLSTSRLVCSRIKTQSYSTCFSEIECQVGSLMRLLLRWWQLLFEAESRVGAYKHTQARTHTYTRKHTHQHKHIHLCLRHFMRLSDKLFAAPVEEMWATY